MTDSTVRRVNDGGNVDAIENYKDYLNKAKQTPRSVFDYSRLKSLTADIGALVPIDCFDVVPGDSITLSNEILVMGFNPLVKRMLDKCTIYVHYYYSRCNDLWKGWNNYITKGRSGKIALTKPKIEWGDDTIKYGSCNNLGAIESGGYQARGLEFLTPMSLAAYLDVPYRDLPIRYSEANHLHWAGQELTNAELKLLPFTCNMMTRQQRYDTYPDVNALPFAMYQRIFRDYYLNKNWVQDNEAWFPTDEDDFILEYTSTLSTGKYATLGKQSNLLSNSIIPVSPVPFAGQTTQFPNHWDTPALPMLRYRQWKKTEKTAGLPWQQRGDQLNLFGANDVAKVDKVMNAQTNLVGNGIPIVRGAASSSNPGTIGYANTSNTNTVYNFNNNGKLGVSLAQLNITANAVRELFVLSQWQENMARTNGDYNQLIEAQFGDNPKWRDRTPMYIGGTRQDLIFNEVLQTSEDGNTPLGTQAGRAVSAGQGYVGKFEVPDYGYIMAIMSIIPDSTNAAQGLPKHMKGGTSFADEYFPLFNNLAPEPILKEEISYTGERDLDEDIAAWRERFAYMKTRENTLGGLLALSAAEPEGADYMAYTFARYHISGENNASVTINNDYLTASYPHVRRDMFSVPTEPMFLVQAASRVRAVRPLPVAVKPASLNGVAM